MLAPVVCVCIRGRFGPLESMQVTACLLERHTEKGDMDADGHSGPLESMQPKACLLERHPEKGLTWMPVRVRTPVTAAVIPQAAPRIDTRILFPDASP